MYELFSVERSAGHTEAAAPHHVSNHVKNLHWLPNWHLSLISVRQDWCSSALTDSYPLYIRLEAAPGPDTGVNTSTYHSSAMEQPDTLLIGFWAEKMLNETLLEIALCQKSHSDDEQRKERKENS